LTNADLHHDLDTAHALFDVALVHSVRDTAVAALKGAESLGDCALRGRSLMLLARYDSEVGRFRRAIHAAQGAVQMFQRTGDLAAEAAALSLLARVNACIGRADEAVEAALLSVRLGELLPEGPAQVGRLNELGMTYVWAQGYASAGAVLLKAEALAVACGTDADSLLPRVSLVWLEIARNFKQRYFSGQLPGLAALKKRLQACPAERAAPTAGLAATRQTAVLDAAVGCARAMAMCWDGHPAQAEEQLRTVTDRLCTDGSVPLIRFYAQWVRAELAWAQGDTRAAQAAALMLIEWADELEFEPMATVGHSMLIQLLESLGRFDLALEEERRYRRRELRIQEDNLDTRDRVVQAHLEVRTSRHDLRQLAERSRELERLSYEDPLTAIPNRRCFEERLAAVLGRERREPGQVPAACLALIDLDDFKAINDTYTHNAGDEVLRSVAQAIRSAVREADLPARFGGDEFVVLFPHASVETAGQICDRIRMLLAGLRWDHVSPHLRIAASIGIAQVEPGDTAATLLQRTDAFMFRAKARPVAAAA
jgi:diguanylate cyclase (GGDEF)-like protein